MTEMSEKHRAKEVKGLWRNLVKHVNKLKKLEMICGFAAHGFWAFP